jgi:hypothetical protein
MADIAVGQRYKLLRKIGNDVNEDGSQADPLHVGWVGEVIGFSPADELGASHHDGDCWVLAFPVPAIAYGEDGQPFMTQVTRNYPVTLAELNDPTYYEPVTEEVSA